MPGEPDNQPNATEGAQFGKYRIVRRIGQGAFGSVYEAVLPGAMGFTKRLAIKRLRSHLGGADSPFAKAMVNEARLGGLLHHANIVDVLEFDQVGPHHYLAMEYVDGVTLAEVIELCRKRRVLLPRFAVVDIALQVCRGLQYAHELCGPDGRPLQVIHRDIKPSNVMVDRGGSAKICDFGIAKAASNLFNETATGFTKGTPRYMSPDQLRDLKPLRPRSDVFSLGVVLFELITARPLFTAESVPALTHQIVFGDVGDRLREAEQAFPGAGRVLDRALRREPAERIQSAEELGEAFRALGRRYPSEAELSRVIARLVQAVDRTESREIRSSGDLDFDASDARGVAEGPAEQPEVEIEPIPAPGADSSGWTRFTHVFPSGLTATGAVADLSPPPASPALEPESSLAQGPDGPRTGREPPAFDSAKPGRRRVMAGIALAGVASIGLLAAVVLAVVLVGIAKHREDPVPEEPREVATGAPEVTPAVETQPEERGDPADDTTPEHRDGAAVGAGDSGHEDADLESAERDDPPVQPVPPEDGIADDSDAVDAEPVGADVAAQPPPPAPGEVSFFVKPWAQVTLDTTYLGGLQRPRKPIPVEGGAHTLRLVCDHEQCPPGHPEKTFDLWIDGDVMRVDGAATPSGTSWLCWDFATGARCD